MGVQITLAVGIVQDALLCCSTLMTFTFLAMPCVSFHDKKELEGSNTGEREVAAVEQPFTPALMMAILEVDVPVLNKSCPVLLVALDPQLLRLSLFSC